MSHLLAISVGPVQEFIAAARRTRDLWFGSYLLSEISRAVAKAIEEAGGKLIFPATLDVENVANKILAEVSDPKAVAERAKRAAQNCWERYAKRARELLDQEITEVIMPGSIWEEQLVDVFEFFAVWVSLTPAYAVDRKRLERLLDGRKNCRDFLPAKGRAGVPKSSLDGQRESVLLQPPKGIDRAIFRVNWPKALRLSLGEELDVVGVTKRLGKQTGELNPRYPSVVRVAAETWLQGVKRRSEFTDLRDECKKLADVHGLNRVSEEKYQYFPFEGTVIFKDRHKDLVTELGEEIKEPLDEVAKLLKNIGGEPNPYLAVLVADGDKMGAMISKLKTADEHREFSQALAGFATAARKIVNEHSGVLIYAGGDDVLAFVPVDKCAYCAQALHEAFGQRLKNYDKPTLSVGLAIAHFMENLEVLLELGRAAERDAKNSSRNALAIHLHKRGGAPVMVRGQWETNLVKRLTNFAGLFHEGILPGKLPYELRELAKLYEDWPPETAGDAIRQDLIRLIAKKQSKGTETVRKALSDACDLKDMTDKKLLQLSEELLVARLLNKALEQSGSYQEKTAGVAS